MRVVREKAALFFSNTLDGVRWHSLINHKVALMYLPVYFFKWLLVVGRWAIYNVHIKASCTCHINALIERNYVFLILSSTKKITQANGIS